MMQCESRHVVARKLVSGEEKKVMEHGHEAVLSLIQTILNDPTTNREVELPSLRFLWGFAWTDPLIFVYEGDDWPTVLYPCDLMEVSGGFLPAAGDGRETAIRGVSSRPFGEAEEEDSSGGFLSDRDYAVHVSLFELVGTVFFIESYRIFTRSRSLQLNSLAKEEYDTPVSPAVIRIIKNECGVPRKENTTSHCIMHLQGREFRQTFFHSFFPLIGVTMKELGKRWYSCLAPGLSQSDVESGGISCSTYNSQPLHDERPLFSPQSHKGMSPSGASIQRDDIPNYTSPRSEEGNADCYDTFQADEVPEESSDLGLRWDIFLQLFIQEERYSINAEACWTTWTKEWDNVNRFDVVDSLDCIITSLGGSREAVHVATAYLDAFVSNSQTVIRDNTFFSGVLLACAMLSCKQVDRFFPSIRAFLRCLRPEQAITTVEFLRYEVHVLKTLDFFLHPLTSLEIVEALLHLCGGPAARQEAERQCRLSDRKRWECDTTVGDDVYGIYNDHDDSSPNEYNIYLLLEEDSTMKHVDRMRWNDMCRMARFITDIMLRSMKAQECRRTVMGLAILAVAAEKTSWALPIPLVELLPVSCRVHNSRASQSPRLDSTSRELLERFAATMRSRCESDGTAAGDMFPLWSVIALVRRCCEECDTGRRAASSVLQQRYGIKEAMDVYSKV